jgi:hypothetical protein
MTMKTDILEADARRDLDRTRENAFDQATLLLGRMARLVKEIEAAGRDGAPPQGVQQAAAALERTLIEWGCKRDALRMVRATRRATTD